MCIVHESRSHDSVSSRDLDLVSLAELDLLGHTPKGSANREIFFTGPCGGGLQRQEENVVMHDLKLKLCRDQLATAHDAFRALINLSDYSLTIGTLSGSDYISFLVSYILVRMQLQHWHPHPL
ncbi:uncharacterized protein LAESUDRAFT_765538 [Laetiporus sulphureus 93-53]|uniref:Uncharacterized protein n=1 Tax=Laetiporus sulphureus 93-53 TaxID=1314785 RepID=A0A165AQ29_9APHY|nr:uncharacterized protein LAESUDRAFT_765538 [Laetiporus sulphureus 93-53]KZS99433.1 hypothetical protein LAESUDRAFT_765538 [Laetiporus sulphureus 93-53]